MHGFIGERAGAGDDADRTLFVDAAGHDADLGFAGGDDAGAVRPDEGDGELLSKAQTFTISSVGMPSVMQTMSGNSRVLGFQDRIGRKRRRNENHGGVGAGRGDGFARC